MEVKIHVETECPVPNQTTNLKITLENIENVGDLKKKLQPSLSVAVCDMSVYHKTKDIKLENETKLSNLYVREGDTFIVHFVSVCDLHFLTELLDKMRAFVENVCEQFEREGNIDWTESDNVAALDECYNAVIQGLEKSNYDGYLRWNYRPTTSNKHYFVQEGGMELLARIYNFASRKQYPMGDSEFESEVAEHFNFQQNEMESNCLIFLWDFLETKEDRQLVPMKMGLEPFFHSLLKDTSDVHGNNTLRVDEASMGCLALCVELPYIQQILAGNMDVLSKLFWLTSNASDPYYGEVTTKILYCCSTHPRAAEKLIENQFYRSVLEKYEAETEKGLKSSDKEQRIMPFTPATGYFLCLFLANIQTLPERNLLPYEEINKINRFLETFVRVVRPSVIGQYQVRYKYLWITLLPFLRLALAGPIKYLETGYDGPNFLNKFPEVQGSIESQVKAKNKQEENSRNEKRVEEEISNNHGSLSPYTFTPAEKLGLYCLCHLADVVRNRDLFKKEKLVDYLICVRWFAQRCPELGELTPKLDGFERLEPPRLESIAKAYASKCFGRKLI